MAQSGLSAMKNGIRIRDGVSVVSLLLNMAILKAKAVSFLDVATKLTKVA